MSTIATLAVGLVANASGFTSGMDGARKSADLFSGSLKSAAGVTAMTRTAAERYEAQLKTLSNHLDHGRIDLDTYTRALASVEAGYKKAQAAADAAKGGGFNLGNALGALGGAALLESGVEKIKGAAEAAAQISHRAEMIGITAEDMGKLEHVAKMTETPIDALTAGVGKLQKNLGELAMGRASKEFTDALQQLQLDPKKLIGKDAIGQLMDLAQGLRGIENPSKRAAVAMEIMGKGGRELVPFLLQGKEAIRALGEEATRLGVALSNADSEKMTEAAHAFTRAQEALTGAMNRGVVALSPYIVKAAEFATAHQSGITAALAGSVAVGGLAIAYNTLAPGMSAALSLAQKMGPAFTAGAVGAGLLAAQLARMAATGEDWSTAALHNINPLLQGIASSGSDATLGNRYKVATSGTDMMNRIGELRLETSRAPSTIDRAPDVQTKTDLTREALSKMQELLELQKAYQADIGKLGQFSSATMIDDKMVQATRDKIHKLQDMLDKFNAENAKRRFGGEVNIVDPEVTKATEALREYIVKLREEWAALHSTTAEAKIYALEHASHASGLAADARGLADLIAGFKAQAEAMKARARATEELTAFTEKLNAQIASGGGGPRAELIEKKNAALEAFSRTVSHIDVSSLVAGLAQIESGFNLADKAVETLEHIKTAEGLKRLAERLDEARDKTMKFGEAQKILNEFMKQNPLAGAREISQAKGLADSIAQMERLKKSISDAKSLAEEGRSPMQKYAEQLTHLQQALWGGAISWTEYARAVRKAADELSKAARGASEFKTFDPANISLAGLSLGAHDIKAPDDAMITAAKAVDAAAAALQAAADYVKDKLPAAIAAAMAALRGPAVAPPPIAPPAPAPPGPGTNWKAPPTDDDALWQKATADINKTQAYAWLAEVRKLGGGPDAVKQAQDAYMAATEARFKELQRRRDAGEPPGGSSRASVPGTDAMQRGAQTRPSIFDDSDTAASGDPNQTILLTDIKTLLQQVVQNGSGLVN